ncbi:pre-mRNA-splicing factor SPF27 [Cryptococcus wingfieldii CBS 7118]|uniref:Pre-mRNA-splicing factor SPF27 n=1 Tax=Cryptococcus wingfieldii CBS 7118 TaxID=1295528 RepID=A0A1E3J4Z6_9TREE|nr:pre-mRNA-splicing factor SPF27 [Cryptococcus wingfieldii CBS 7118]ODN95715.1 pre-mRNA-splicing factor SPF27 [Cryptococcus wingfieldii CBS 7118]
MSFDQNIDALPYVDKQVEDPAVKAAAQALIEAELRQTPQIDDNDQRLPPNVDVFSKSKSLQELLANYPSAPLQGIDVTKYQPPTVREGATVEELKEAEEQGRTGEGHMGLRVENTSILSTYGPNAWLVRNYQLNAQLSELQGTLSGLKEQVTETNRTRRVFQEDAGLHLERLEGRWSDLVSSTTQLEMACNAMDGEVAALERRENQLKAEVAQLEG